jgi:hypothetical protein
MSTTTEAANWLPPTPDQWPLVVDETVTPDRPLTRGVRQHADLLQTVGGAQRAQVLDVDLADPNVRLGVVESHDHLTDTADEVPSSMAHRTGAVAGINGDFFQIYASGRPLGMVVIDGRLVKSPDPTWNADLWVRHDGSIGIGTESYTGTVTDGATGAGSPRTSARPRRSRPRPWPPATSTPTAPPWSWTPSPPESQTSHSFRPAPRNWSVQAPRPSG